MHVGNVTMDMQIFARVLTTRKNRSFPHRFYIPMGLCVCMCVLREWGMEASLSQLATQTVGR
jgi:hypothetical protein